MLLVLLLGIADFGRVFQAGISLEAASRNGAEAAALERLRTRPPATEPERTNYYRHLHDLAAQTTCSEARVLANTTYVADDPMTAAADDEICPSWPAIASCVHDGLDPLCGSVATGYAGPLPPECSVLTDPWNTSVPTDTVSYSVEVRTCYRFTTLFNLKFALPFGWGMNLGEVILQRARTFVVDCAPGTVSGC